MSEQQLIERLIAKDKTALEYLYDHYSGALNGVILRIVGNEDVAEEVLQDAFFKFWERIEMYDRKKGTLFTWMLAISRNLALDKLRSKNFKKSKKTDDIENSVSTSDSRHFTEQKIENIGVKDILKDLNEDQKFIIEMLYFQGYTQSELAEEHGIPLGTVKTRLRAAILKLRKLIVL